MTKNQKIFVAIVTALIVSVAGYFYYQQQKLHSPEYSLTLLTQDAVKHNWLGVNERLNIEALCAQAFDEVIAPSLVQHQAVGASDVMKDVLGRMRGNFTRSMIDYGKQAIEAPNLDKVPPPVQIFARRFVDTTNLSSCYVKSVESSTVHGNTATVNALLTNKKIQQDFPLSVEMERMPDKTWKLIGVNKLPELIAAMDKAQSQKLEILNKPIQDKMDKEISIQPSLFALVTREKPWKATAFTYNPTFNFSGSQDVARFMGQVDVLDKDGNVLYSQKYIEEGPFKAGSKQPIRFSWTLNPFQAKEKALIALSTKDLTIKERILSVTFTDNSNIQLLEVLPSN